MEHFHDANKLPSAGYIADHHETEAAENEADLIKHAICCRKNPGHKDFIPVNDFSISHLPARYQDNDIVDIIKATADLTVRVNVTFVSPRRPELCPGTDHPYPFHNQKGSAALRSGTGRVWRMSEFSELNCRTCQCEKCQHSSTPSSVWGFVYVNTATHVVFDDAEAKRTKCRFFFDGEDSPLVTADGCSADANVVNDKCRLKLITCDVDLLKRLKKLKTRWRELRATVNLKKRVRHQDEGRLTFIVSHPHGCSKCISIGRCIRGFKLKNTVKYTYTTCTCPGSSGALVYIVGCNDGLGYNGQIHSGVNSEGENVSGIGGNMSILDRLMLHSLTEKRKSYISHTSPFAQTM